MVDMIEKSIESLVGTAPSAVAIIIVVVLFLQHLKERDLLLRQLHVEHEESRKMSRAIIERNSEVLGQYLEQGRETAVVMKEIAANMRSCQLIQQQWLERSR